jgi:hypothetical protein
MFEKTKNCPEPGERRHRRQRPYVSLKQAGRSVRGWLGGRRQKKKIFGIGPPHPAEKIFFFGIGPPRLGGKKKIFFGIGPPRLWKPSHGREQAWLSVRGWLGGRRQKNFFFSASVPRTRLKKIIFSASVPRGWGKKFFFFFFFGIGPPGPKRAAG